MTGYAVPYDAIPLLPGIRAPLPFGFLESLRGARAARLASAGEIVCHGVLP